ncbi:MAG TPA: hypothetical protein VGE76_09015 [Opitutaceae bacterium]
MTELEQLTQLCERLGAPGPQAATMAAQLMKRADQLAAERGIAREAAMRGLLEVVVKGRAGEVPAQFAPPKPAPDAGPAQK